MGIADFSPRHGNSLWRDRAPAKACFGLQLRPITHPHPPRAQLVWRVPQGLAGFTKAAVALTTQVVQRAQGEAITQARENYLPSVSTKETGFSTRSTMTKAVRGTMAMVQPIISGAPAPLETEYST